MSTTAARTSTTTPRQRPPRTRLGGFGLLLVAVAILIQLVAGILDGLTDEVAFFAVGAVVSLAGGLLALRFGRWAAVTGLVVSVVMVLGFFWVAFGVGFPASPVEFTSGIAYAAGVVLALWGNVAALRSGGRGVEDRGSPRHRVVMRSASVAVLVAAVASVVVAVTTGQTVDPSAAQAADATATMSGFEFTEGRLEVASGQAATVLVRNQDAFVHDFTVPDLDIARTLAPGDQVLVELDAPTGTYTVYCTLHADTSVTEPEDAGMAATLVVR